jgi:hypothetical protein
MNRKIHPGMFVIVFLLLVGGAYYFASFAPQGDVKIQIEEIR